MVRETWVRIPQCLCGELRRTNPDHRHHPACLAELGAMRKEALGVACCTTLNNANVIFGNTRVTELAEIRRHQVEMDLRPEIAMSRRALI